MRRVLVIESGNRGITERLLPLMRRNHGQAVAFDLLTCFPGLPAGLPDSAAVFRVPERPDRRGLLRDLRARRPDVVAVICSGEPFLFKSKVAVASLVAAKVFIVNENADYFPLDYAHAGLFFRMALDRAGLSGHSAARNIGGVICFPFALGWLVLYALWAHTRRALNLAFRQ